MSRLWKIALAAGGLAALWLMTRSDEDERPATSAGGSSSGGGARPSSGGTSGSAAAPSSGGSSADSAGGSAPAGASPEQDGGVVRDGRMRGGTWNFAPADAPSDARGFLVLRDVPKSSIKVDGKTVELRGGFRGFREVPSGKHELQLEGYGGTKVESEIDMPAGGCIVLIYDDAGGKPSLQPDRDWGPQYIGLAMGGAMGQARWPWPEER